MLLLPKCAYDGSNSLSTFNMKICGLVTRIYEICVSSIGSSRIEEMQGERTIDRLNRFDGSGGKSYRQCDNVEDAE